MNILTFKNGVIGLILAVTVIAYLRYQPSILSMNPSNNIISGIEISDKADAKLAQPTQSTKPSPEIKNTVDVSGMPVSNPMDQITTVAGTPAERELYARWKIARGYPDESGVYNSYDEETLTKLADSGDIQAMHMLADLYTDENHMEKYGVSAAIDMQHKAAVYGSTYAFLRLGIRKMQHFITGFEENDPLRHKAALETLAIFNVAALRGDRMPNISLGNSFTSQYGTPLTDTDKAYIQSRSQEMYDALQKRRTELGLGDFDNSVPPATTKFFDIVESTP